MHKQNLPNEKALKHAQIQKFEYNQYERKN